MAELLIKEKVGNQQHGHSRRPVQQIMEHSYKGMECKQLKMWEVP